MSCLHLIGIRNDIDDIRLLIIDLYRGVSGHTYMEPDTQGGRIQREARKILLSRDDGFIHVMAKNDTDPSYTRSWAAIAGSLNGMTLVLPEMNDFHRWSEFLLPPENGGISNLHIVPSGKCCYSGPHSTDKSFLITKSHYLNFGYGEDGSGKVVAHHGVWFSRNSFAQGTPDEIVVRQYAVHSEAEWRQKRQCEAEKVKRPEKKQTEPNELAYLKQKDLHELGKLMSRQPGDFDERYPDPDKGGRDKRTDQQKLEDMQEVRRILHKDAESGRPSSTMTCFIGKWGDEATAPSKQKHRGSRSGRRS